MSRKGKLPIVLGDKVKVSIVGSEVIVTGPKGVLKKTFASCVKIQQDSNTLTVIPLGSDRLSQAMHGTARSILANMVRGVQEVFSKDLEIQGVGFKAALNGTILDLSLGFSHVIKYKIPEGIAIQVKDGTKVHVEGADKHLVGQVAAHIKYYYPVEPYKGKGVRIAGEFVRHKEGKKKA
jgi:large subunit ribosomal protein L6